MKIECDFIRNSYWQRTSLLANSCFSFYAKTLSKRRSSIMKKSMMPVRLLSLGFF